jgi:hypothetical protein
VNAGEVWTPSDMAKLHLAKLVLVPYP